MAKPLELLDPEVYQADNPTSDPAVANPIPLTVGGDFEPGDWRIVRVIIDDGYTFNATPSGWTKITDSVVGFVRIAIFRRILAAGDADSSVSVNTGAFGYNAYYTASAITVRNLTQTQTLSPSSTTVAAATSGASPSVSTGLGALVTWHTANASGTDTLALTTPSGMTALLSGEPLFGTATMATLISYEARTSGASGTRTSTSSRSAAWMLTSLFVEQAPDVTQALAKITAGAPTVKALAIALANLTTWPLAKIVVPPPVVRPIWSPLSGYRVSDPLVIPEGSVSGSKILYRTTEPAGTTVVVETSLDNGASWQVVDNNSSIPRLRSGVSTVRSVLTKVSLSRTAIGIPTPRVHDMEVVVAVDTGPTELMPLGVFLINDTGVTDNAGGLTVDVSGVDLSWQIARNKWTDLFIIKFGTNYATAIKKLITDRRPGTLFNFATTTRRTPRLIFGKDPTDPWKDAQEMAAAIGMELFFDARGVCTLREEPDPDVGDAVWEFTDLSNPTMTAITRRTSSADTFNVIIVRGEGSFVTTPVRWVEEDLDPASPTYVLGPYGRHADEFRSAMVVTPEQARDAAKALLRRHKGATEAVELEAIPMPALEPGDIIAVTRGRSRVSGQWLIDTLSLPLGAGQLMRATMRRQRLG